MNTAAGSLLVSVIGLGTPAVIFLWRAIPLRRERPELLQNGLWFMLPFLLMPITWLFILIIAPIALIIVVLELRLPSTKRGSLFYAALGELIASVLSMSMIYIINTYFA